MQMLVDATLDYARGLKRLAVTAKTTTTVVGHVVILRYLGEALRKQDAPALLVRKRISPLERESLTITGRIQLATIVVVGMISVPRTTGNLPVLTLVFGAEARIDNPGGAILGVLGRIDIGIVGVGERHIRAERHTLANLNATGPVDDVRRRRQNRCGHDQRRGKRGKLSIH